MKCEECNGSGVFDRVDVHEIPCNVCDGTGTLLVAKSSIPITATQECTVSGSSIEELADKIWDRNDCEWGAVHPDSLNCTKQEIIRVLEDMDREGELEGEVIKRKDNSN